MNSNGTELEKVVHTHGTSFWGGWPRGFGSRNPNAHSWIFTSVSVGPSSRSYLFSDTVRILFTLVWHRTYPICDAPTSRSAWHSFALLQKSRRRNHRCCGWTEALSGMVSRFSRVGWFSRALAFRLLYYPWGKMGTTCSLSVNIALAHTSAQFWLCQKVNIL